MILRHWIYVDFRTIGMATAMVEWPSAISVAIMLTSFILRFGTGELYNWLEKRVYRCSKKTKVGIHKKESRCERSRSDVLYHFTQWLNNEDSHTCEI
jgi:hypothetical protein